MSRKLGAGLASLLGLALLMGIWWGVEYQTSAAPAPQTIAGEQPPGREREGDPNAPQISFIDSPTAQCILPEPHKDTCYIQWGYMQVTASSSQYVISMSVAIDGRLRAYYGGFFQTSMHVPGDMQSPGFRVSCGPPGASGLPTLGSTHSYTIRARETGGLRAANYGSVTCPADIVPLTSVSLDGPTVGATGTSYPFTATVFPITTTLPVTYAWHVSGHTTLTVTQGMSATENFAWSQPGSKLILVEAINRLGSALASHTIIVETPISGPAAYNDSPTTLGATTHLTATIAAGSNVSYSWKLGDGATADGPLVIHTYSAPGIYTAVVTVNNQLGSQQSQTTVKIVKPDYFGYLPLLLRSPRGTAAP